jgi:hypothetical protein
MEVEQNGSLPFLDVLVSRKPDGSLGHSVYTRAIQKVRFPVLFPLKGFLH